MEAYPQILFIGHDISLLYELLGVQQIELNDNHQFNPFTCPPSMEDRISAK